LPILPRFADFAEICRSFRNLPILPRFADFAQICRFCQTEIPLT